MTAPAVQEGKRLLICCFAMSFPTDTTPEAEATHLALLRQAGLSRRVALMRSLSRQAVELSRQALAQRHPDLSQEDLDLAFIALCYGEDLADRVRPALRQRCTP